jgi:hypothetical protein
MTGREGWLAPLLSSAGGTLRDAQLALDPGIQPDDRSGRVACPRCFRGHTTPFVPHDCMRQVRSAQPTLLVVSLLESPTPFTFA